MLVALFDEAGTDFFFHMGIIEDEVDIFPLPIFGGLFLAASNLKLSGANNIIRFAAVR